MCSEFSRPNIAYHHRFHSLQVFETPAYLSFEQYDEQTSVSSFAGIAIERVLQAALNSFESARIFFDQMLVAALEPPLSASTKTDVEALLKVAKMNTVFARLAFAGRYKDSTIAPLLDFTLHRDFPVVKFQ